MEQQVSNQHLHSKVSRLSYSSVERAAGTISAAHQRTIERRVRLDGSLSRLVLSLSDTLRHIVPSGDRERSRLSGLEIRDYQLFFVPRRLGRARSTMLTTAMCINRWLS